MEPDQRLNITSLDIDGRRIKLRGWSKLTGARKGEEQGPLELTRCGLSAYMHVRVG